MTNASKATQRQNRKVLAEALEQDPRSALWVTLNFNAQYPLHVCDAKLERLGYRLHRSLFRGREYQDVATKALMLFYAATERCKNGNPHIHMTAFVTDSVECKFKRRLPKIWQNLVPSGSIHLLDFRRGDPSALSWYATKDTDRRHLEDSFVCSLALNIPACGGRVGPAKTTRAKAELTDTESEVDQ